MGVAGILLLVLTGTALGQRMLHMPDLGRRMYLGELYDARTNQPVSGTLWPQWMIDRVKVDKPARYQELKYSLGDDLRAKANMMELDLQLFLDFLGGVIQVEAAAGFLMDKRKSTNKIRASVKNSMRTVKETLDAYDDNLQSVVNLALLNDDKATHVVTAVTWGADTICVFEADNTETYSKNVFDFAVHVKLFVGVATGSVSVALKVGSEVLEAVNKSTVHLHGDVLPPTSHDLPTSAHEAMQFMRSIHQFTLANGGKGVPVTLELTPISWLQTTAGKAIVEISEDMLERTIEVYESLERSDERIQDLLNTNYGGFQAWVESVYSYQRFFQSARVRFAREISEAVGKTRQGVVDAVVINDLLQGYWAGPIEEGKVLQTVEDFRDQIHNLMALVDQMTSFGVTFATSYAEYQSPTFNSVYDRVYALVLVGMVPSADRAALAKVRDFASLAKARRTDAAGDPRVKHCVMRTRDSDGATVCTEKLKFVVVHFDSYCSEICNAKYCPNTGNKTICPTPPVSEGCTASTELQERLNCVVRPQCDTNDAGQQDSLTKPLAECWCACPRTQILEFVSSRSPVRLEDDMPRVPARPTIDSITGLDVVETDPFDQRATIVVAAGDLGTVRNFRVRITWPEAVVEGEDISWKQRLRIVDTVNDDRTISIHGLIAGKRYRFEVAGMNHVGEGLYSAAHPVDDYITVAHNIPTITPTFPTSHGITPENLLPGWRTVYGTGTLPITVKLSTHAPEPIGRVEFYLKAGGKAIECSRYSAASTQSVQCEAKIHEHPVTADTEMEARVLGVNGDLMAWGNVTVQAPTETTCFEWDEPRSLLCDTEISQIIGADVEEWEPLHQVATIRLARSHVSSRLLRYKVRVIWRQAGSISVEDRVFFTVTNSPSIVVWNLLAGVEYQFQIAGIDVDGDVGLYNNAFPENPVLVAHNMPVIEPIDSTNIADPPTNTIPGWLYQNLGSINVNVSLSARAVEPIAKVLFRRLSGGIVECENYGEQSPSYITCTVPVSKIPDGTTQLNATVHGVNGGLLAWHLVNVLPASRTACSAWETTNTLFCNITQPEATVYKCVDKCDNCMWNAITTHEFDGMCTVSPCPAGKVWCPLSKECFDAESFADKGCAGECGGRTVYRATRGICAVPCKFTRLPGVEVPPGVSHSLLCPMGTVWRSTAHPVSFECPEYNQEYEEAVSTQASWDLGRLRWIPKKAVWKPRKKAIPERASPLVKVAFLKRMKLAPLLSTKDLSPVMASWALPQSEMPDCIPCTNLGNCNGHAVQVSSNVNRTACVCTCKTEYAGRDCSECSAGHFGYPVCQKCTVEKECSGNALQASPDPSRRTCECSCKKGFKGQSCDQCDTGYIGYPNCQKCASDVHCSNHAWFTYSNADNTKCHCLCRSGYTGEKCDECKEGYTGYPLCVKCSNEGDCNGNAVTVGVDASRNCFCACKPQFTGDKCNRCADGYGDYPRCSDRWVVQGTSCPSGATVRRVKWMSKRCSAFTSCETASEWKAAGDSPPRCQYRSTIFSTSTCSASTVSHVECD